MTVFICICICIYTHLYVWYMYVCMYMHTHMCSRPWIKRWLGVCMYTYVYIYTHTHTYTGGCGRSEGFCVSPQGRGKCAQTEAAVFRKCTQVGVFLCVNVCMYLCKYVCICKLLSPEKHTQVRVQMHVCLCEHACMYLYVSSSNEALTLVHVFE